VANPRKASECVSKFDGASFLTKDYRIVIHHQKGNVQDPPTFYVEVTHLLDHHTQHINLYLDPTWIVN